MADYVSRETAPDAEQVAALGRFLHRHKFGSPVDVAYTISAVRRPPGGDPAEILWVDDTIRLGDASATQDLVGECARRAAQGWRAALLLDGPGSFGLDEGEVAIVGEVCARPRREGVLTSRLVMGDLYGLHALPARNPRQAPSPPVYPAAAANTGLATPPGDGVRPPGGL